jgi:hypothetical protein
MPGYQSNIPEELLKSLQHVTTLMQNLLGDIKENSTSLALVKEKLESLTSNVNALSHVVRDGNGKGSMITRLALAEKSIEDFEQDLHEIKEEINSAIREIKVRVEKEKNELKKNEIDEAAFRRRKTIEKLKIVGLLTPGVIACVMQILNLIFG